MSAADNTTVFYFGYGVQAGYYHYAVNHLIGIHRSEPDADLHVFYVGQDDQSHFPDYVTEHHYLYTGHESTVRNVLRSLVLQLSLLIALLRRRPDVLHASTYLRTQRYTCYVTALTKLFRVPLLRTVHEETGERLHPVSRQDRRFARWHLRHADHLFTHTEAASDALREQGIETPATVVPHGNYCCFRRYMDNDAESPYGDQEAPVVLFFGVKRHKGVEVFLDALAQGSAAVEPWLVGPVNAGDETFAQRARDDDRVRTAFGFVPDEELWRYFHFADIVCLPYLEGTTSGALHTALAFENAVVVSALPCFTEYVQDGETALVLPETTPPNLADAIDRLATDTAFRERLATAGFDLERSPRFDWERIGGVTLDVYRALADGDAE